jgi:hypothetical protein
MQPMMQPPQMGGQGQMQQPPRAPVMRSGTSKAVPVVISAGLAVGVFCGLLFGLGVEKDKTAVAAPTTTTTKQADPEVPEPFQPTATKPTPPAKTPDTKPTGSPIAVAAAGSGSGAKPAAGSGSATIPAKPTAKLTIEITPEAVAKSATITVDGKELEQNALEVDLGDAKKKDVKVLIKAAGYKDVEQKVEVLADHDNLYKVELVKRSSGGGLTRPPPPGGNGTKKPPNGNGTKKPPGGGLIDI